MGTDAEDQRRDEPAAEEHERKPERDAGQHQPERIEHNAPTDLRREPPSAMRRPNSVARRATADQDAEQAQASQAQCQGAGARRQPPMSFGRLRPRWIRSCIVTTLSIGSSGATSAMARRTAGSVAAGSPDVRTSSARGTAARWASGTNTPGEAASPTR